MAKQGPEHSGLPPYPTEQQHATAPYPQPFNVGDNTPYHIQPPPPYSPAPTYAVPTVQPVTVVTAAAPITIMGLLGSESNQMTCPYCNAIIRTKIDKHPSGMAYLSGFLIAIMGCFCGCCLIPCFMDSCKAVEHRCPNCDHFLGKYSKYF